MGGYASRFIQTIQSSVMVMVEKRLGHGPYMIHSWRPQLLKGDSAMLDLAITFRTIHFRDYYHKVTYSSFNLRPVLTVIGKLLHLRQTVNDLI